jgi:hypothetical protein
MESDHLNRLHALQLERGLYLMRSISNIGTLRIEDITLCKRARQRKLNAKPSVNQRVEEASEEPIQHGGMLLSASMYIRSCSEHIFFKKRGE